ncbi:unnamed protein product [Cuscuta campestris]|uniref:Uncharacterized protein n=1 Tax=Cuscuta campestris TaxID=132261 RepID=A0A484LJ21_9ASTE|nr:unnamed protein product [Cuscuta campestris]
MIPLLKAPTSPPLPKKSSNFLGKEDHQPVSLLSQNSEEIAPRDSVFASLNSRCFSLSGLPPPIDSEEPTFQPLPKIGFKRSQLKSHFQYLLTRMSQELDPHRRYSSQKHGEVTPSKGSCESSKALVTQGFHQGLNQQVDYFIDPRSLTFYKIIEQIGVSLHDNIRVYRAMEWELNKTFRPYTEEFIFNGWTSVMIANSNEAGFIESSLQTFKNTFVEPHESFLQVVTDFLNIASMDYCMVIGFAKKLSWGSTNVFLMVSKLLSMKLMKPSSFEFAIMTDLHPLKMNSSVYGLKVLFSSHSIARYTRKL